MVFPSNKAAIENLEASYDGPSVRKALIDLLETLSEVGGDVKNLGGHSASYYVLTSELDFAINEITSWMQYDNEPIKSSLKVMTNKDFTTYFKNNLLDRLKKINGDTNGDYEIPEKEKPELIGNNYHDCITILNGTIDDIYDAIRDQHVTIYDDDDIMDLAERISQIKLGNLNVIPITITENNKTIPSDIVYDEGVPISGTAYNPVTVNVQLKGYAATATSNGQVELPDGYDGFSSVSIDVPVSGGSGGSGSGSGGSGGGSGEYIPKLTTMDITTNGQYSPPNGYEGFSEVNVEVTKPALPDDGEQPTVTFKFKSYEGEVGEEALDEQTVLIGEDAKYNGSPVEIEDESDFYYFKGWYPRPDRVANDMTTYTDIGLWTPKDTYIGPTYEWCPYSWKQIIKGDDEPSVGSLKLLKLKYNNDIVRMMYMGGRRWMCIDYKDYGGMPNDDRKPWRECGWRDWLENDFKEKWIPDWLLSHMTRCINKQAEVIDTAADISTFKNTKSIVASQVGDLYPNTVYSGIVAYGTQYRDSLDLIWIPSMDEFGLYGGLEEGDFYEGIYGSNTVSYNTRYRTEEHVIDEETTVTYYLRNGYDTINYYKACGRKLSKIPTAYQRGLMVEGQENRDAQFSDTILKKFKFAGLSSVQSLYSSGTLQANQSPDVVYRPIWESYYENPLPRGTYDFDFRVPAGNTLTASMALRDQTLMLCNLNDYRYDDEYGGVDYDYTYIHKPLAKYHGGSDNCNSQIGRAGISAYGYPIKSLTGALRVCWTIQLGD